MKNLNNFSWVFSGLTVVSSLSAANKTSKPNILIVLCDDLGYCDVGFNGSHDIKTPNLDKLAKNGAICTSAYVAHPFSGPSRASIMTGRYPQTIGVPYNLPEHGKVSDTGVPINEPFVSNVMHEAGYYTVALGKWHLGSYSQFQPTKRGFDEYYGFLGGGFKYFPDDITSMKNTKPENIATSSVRNLFHNNTPVPQTEYITDQLTHQTVRILDEVAKKDQPFFMYLAYNAPHAPLVAKEDDMKKFSKIKDLDRRTYAAMVYAVDRGVGEIVKTLKANGQFENTLIVFLSDNGGNFNLGANNFPLQGTKGDTWEGGFRVPMFYHWPDKIAAGQRIDYPISALDLFPTFSQLANAQLPTAKVLDGEDIMGVLQGEKRPLDDRMIYAFRHREGFNDVAARKGDWKITRMGNEPWHLFNITADIGEHKDLSGKYPDRLKSMVEATQKWTLTHVKPLWFYSAEDEELWNDGILPGYNKTFEVEKLVLPPLIYQLKR